MDNQQKSSIQEPEKRSQTIDMNRIQDIFGDNKAAIKEFINLFINSTDQLLQDILVSMNEQNQDEAKKLFHRLKGSAGNSGMMIMHELCVSAEQMIAKSDWKMLAEINKSIVNQFEQIKSEAKRLLD